MHLNQNHLSSDINITCYEEDYEEPKTMEFTLMNTLRKDNEETLTDENDE
jgi:hypothetical protein